MKGEGLKVKGVRVRVIVRVRVMFMVRVKSAAFALPR